MRVSEVFSAGGGGGFYGGEDCHEHDRYNGCTFTGYHPGYDYSRDYGRNHYYYNGYNYGGWTYCGYYRFLGIL